MWRTSLSVAQIQSLEFQVKPDTCSWAQMCHPGSPRPSPSTPLFSLWKGRRHHCCRPIPLQCWQKEKEEHFKEIPTRLRKQMWYCTTLQWQIWTRSRSVTGRKVNVARPSWGYTTVMCTRHHTEHSWSDTESGVFTTVWASNSYVQVFF